MGSDKIKDAVYERNYVYVFNYHLIWVTKYRRQIFTTPALVNEMKDILNDIAIKADVTIRTMEVMPDHIHMMISFKPKYAPTSIVKTLKGHSARAFFKLHPEIKKQKLWEGHLWSHSYYIGTVGNMSKETVEKYINSQYSKK